MTNKPIDSAWPVLRRQAQGLDLPWLEKLVNQHAARDPFQVLISCILSLRTQDRTTGAASERLFSLAPAFATGQELKSTVSPEDTVLNSSGVSVKLAYLEAVTCKEYGICAQQWKRTHGIQSTAGMYHETVMHHPCCPVRRPFPGLLRLCTRA